METLVTIQAGKLIMGNVGIVDGFLYVKGNVGNNSIERMRRGNVIIEGNIGDYACNDMLSGNYHHKRQDR